MKICSKCGGELEPRINSNPDSKLDNLYHCNKCGSYYNANDETYEEHIEIVKNKLEDGK